MTFACYIEDFGGDFILLLLCPCLLLFVSSFHCSLEMNVCLLLICDSVFTFLLIPVPTLYYLPPVT